MLTCFTGNKMLKDGPHGNVDRGTLTHSWLHKIINTAITAFNQEKPLIDRIGYSMDTQCLTQRMIDANQSNSSSRGTEPEYLDPENYLVKDPTAVVTFHNGLSRHAVIERVNALNALFGRRYNQKKVEDLLHFNRPQRGDYIPPKKGTQDMSSCIQAIWYDPYIDTSSRGPYRNMVRENIDFSGADHPYFPVDFDVRMILNPMQWTDERLFGDVQSTWILPIGGFLNVYGLHKYRTRAAAQHDARSDRRSRSSVGTIGRSSDRSEQLHITPINLEPSTMSSSRPEGELDVDLWDQWNSDFTNNPQVVTDSTGNDDPLNALRSSSSSSRGRGTLPRSHQSWYHNDSRYQPQHERSRSRHSPYSTGGSYNPQDDAYWDSYTSYIAPIPDYEEDDN